MVLVHILRLPDSKGVRVEDDVDEAELVKTTSLLDNDHERTTAVEYRFPGSDIIVHRSAHVTIKQWPAGMTGEVGRFA